MVWRRPNQPEGPAPEKDYGPALVEARRRLDDQLKVVDASKARVAGMLGVGGLVGTFAGSLGTDPGGVTADLWVAAGAFGVAVVAGLLALAPWKFHGALDAGVVVGWVDVGEPRPAVERDLALRVDQQVIKNTRKASALQWALIVVALAVAVEFAALTYHLIRSN